MATKQAPKDVLDVFVEAATKNPNLAVMAALWANRLRCPDMYVKVTERDLNAFRDSMAYLKVKPAVRIHREPSIPAQAAIPAMANRRAVPARPAVPAKPYLTVQLVEEGTVNGIVPVENNQADFDAREEMAAIRRARDNAPRLAEMLEKAKGGDFSTSDLSDAAAALLLLAKGVE